MALKTLPHLDEFKQFLSGKSLSDLKAMAGMGRSVMLAARSQDDSNPINSMGPCNNWALEANATQRYVLIQFLCVILSYITDEEWDCSDPEDYAEFFAWFRCMGSPAKIDLLITQFLCEEFPQINCKQPVCTSPLDLEILLFYIIFLIAWSMELGGGDGGGT